MVSLRPFKLAETLCVHPMLNIAIRAARAGGRVLTQSMNRIETIRIESKGKNDFVSEVDRSTEAEIVNTLQRSYPDHRFICEENGEIGPPDAEFQWYIDPLDGTKNFLHGYPAYCVSIAVAKDNRLDQAVIYNPVSQELFTGSRGAGATLDGKRIRVASLNGLEHAMLSSGYANDGKSDFEAYLKTLAAFTDRASGIRRQGSAALDLAYVAAGRLDGYWQFGLKKWDTAAGALIVREAGGLIGDMTGDEHWFESGNVVAASPKVFNSMIRTFREMNIKEI